MISLDTNAFFSDNSGTFLKEVNNELISASMCLSLDWNSSATLISVGCSDGSVSVISILESKFEVLQGWKAHEFEVWGTSFDINQPHVLYTGSDDCKFRCWDLRCDSPMLASQSANVHKMGVCCIAQSPNRPHTILTGSYDEQLRIWDARSITKPINETPICLGGGVWRIKHHPFVPSLVLAACMHNGFAVLNIEGGNAVVTETYMKHDSLAYGVDWQRRRYSRNGSFEESSVIATCSFYDRLLRIWIPQCSLA